MVRFMKEIQDSFGEAIAIYSNCALRKCYFAHKGLFLNHSFNQNL